MEKIVKTIAEYPIYFSEYGNYVLIPLLILILMLDWKISKRQLPRKNKITYRILFGALGIVLGTLIFMINFPLKPMINSLSKVDKSIGTNMVDIEYLNVKNGKVESIKNYNDKIVLLNFWATYCAPCLREFPDLKKLEATFPDKLVVIAISNESPGKINEFIVKIESPSIVGSQKKDTWINPENFLPLTVIVKSGIIKERYFGSKSYNEFVEIIENITSVD